MKKIQWIPEGVKKEAPSDASLYTFLLKIAARCNLNCDYCYIYQGPDQSWRSRPKFMSDDIAQQTFRRIEEHVIEHSLNQIAITFHGGEALLAGHERFKNYLQSAEDIISCDIDFAIQTNGILLSPEFLNLFSEHEVNIGMSIDGNRQMNDKHRRFLNGKSSFDRVMQSIALINSNPKWAVLLTGYLAVIDLQNNPTEVFGFLSSIDNRGFDMILPDCNHEIQPPRPENDISNIAYGKWLADFFDTWILSGKDIEIRYFEEIIAMLLGQRSMMENIGAKFVDLIIVESDGEIEPVDTLKMVGRQATSLGLNVFSNSFSDALNEEAIYSRLLGYEVLCEECCACSYLDQCGGGYIPHRYKSETGFINPSVYCNDIKYLVDHIRRKLGSELAA